MPESENREKPAVPGPLFVVGIWRSGTSLLYALLNQHPDIALLYEGDLPLFWPLFLRRGGKSDWTARWDFWNSALKRHHLDPAKFPAEITDLKTAVETVYQEFARRKGAIIWGCKSPSYFDSLVRLAENFPAARFIVIWRNPANICRSILRASGGSSWFGRAGTIHRALLGCRELKAERDRLVERGTPLHEIQYEDLTRNPHAVMEGICRFLSIPFDPKMASLENADRSAIYSAEHHALVKSERIVSTVERAEVLTGRLAAKINRYVAYWHQRYHGEWPPFPRPQKDIAPLPSVWERIRDRALYRTLRWYDSAILSFYCFAPLWLLRAYRSLKRRPAAALSKAEDRPTMP